MKTDIHIDTQCISVFIFMGEPCVSIPISHRVPEDVGTQTLLNVDFIHKQRGERRGFGDLISGIRVLNPALTLGIKAFFNESGKS